MAKRLVMARLLVGLVVVAVVSACGVPPRPPKQPPKTPGVDPGAVWDAPARCREVVASGLRLGREADRVRVATWNIRWFPDGIPGITPEKVTTDLGWVACALAYLDADVVALQEIKLTERGHRALAQVTRDLGELTKARWSWIADGCKAAHGQHLVIVYREDRVVVSAAHSHGVVDPTAKAHGDPECPGSLRPALGVYLRSLRGGADFHLVTVHLDSGRKPRDFDNRVAAWERLQWVQQERFALVADTDVVVAGDFNLMGSQGGEVANSAQEIAALSRAVHALASPLRLPPIGHTCTEYHRGRGTVLDAVLVTQSMQEAAESTQEVSGLCAARRCREIPRDHPILGALSDHCPVVIDLLDRDLDPPLVEPVSEPVAPAPR